MKIRYDSSADAAYIQVANDIAPGGVARSYLCDPAEAGGMINLDFDAAGHLVGIEVLGAASLIPSDVLESPEVRGD